MLINAVNPLGGRLWPGGVMPIDIDDDFTPRQRQKILDTADLIERVTNVRIPERVGAAAPYVSVRPTNGNISFSKGVGWGGRNVAHIVGLSRGAGVGTIAHEFLHALGLYHEQSRTDRESFVEVVFENLVGLDRDSTVISSAERTQIRNMLGIDEAEFRARMDALFEKRQEADYQFRTARDSVNLAPYDYNSVMHYPRNLFGECVAWTSISKKIKNVDQGACPPVMQGELCADGSVPAAGSSRCITLRPLQTIPTVELACSPDQAPCPSTGTYSDSTFGQSIGLSPDDISELNTLYESDTGNTVQTLVTVLASLEPQNDPGRFNLTLDGEDMHAMGGSFAPHTLSIGPISVEPGTHQFAVVPIGDTNPVDYEIDFSRDCSTNGLVVSGLDTSLICVVDITATYEGADYDSCTADCGSLLDSCQFDPMPAPGSRPPACFELYEGCLQQRCEPLDRPEIASLVAPIGRIVEQNPAFAWNGDPRARVYQIRVTETCSARTIVGLAPAQGSCIGTNCVANLDLELTPNRSYLWSIRGRKTLDGMGDDYGSWSNEQEFLVADRRRPLGIPIDSPCAVIEGPAVNPTNAIDTSVSEHITSE